MATANEELFNSTLRHSIQLRRVTVREARLMIELLEKSDRELVSLLRARLVQGDFTSQRYKSLLRDIRLMRKALWKGVQDATQGTLFSIAELEQGAMVKILDKAIPVQLDYATASAAKLRALITAQPFAGGANSARTLSGWFQGLEVADRQRIVEALNLGMAQDETVDQMVNRVKQTFPITARNATTVVRTAVNHVSNAARGAFFEANDDIVSALRWTATLDGRTSIICAGRDGHHAPVTGKSTKGVPQPWLSPLTARPPAHPNCRSVMTAVLDADGIEAKMPRRPFVRDTRTRRQREKDFRAEAKESVGAKEWSNMSTQARNDMIRDQRRAWTSANVGTVPGATTYDSWLRQQTNGFQNEVLGPGKAKLFREGLPLDKYVDRAGNELTIPQLQEEYGL